MATQKNAKENTVTGSISSMIRVEMQGRWERDLYGPIGGGRKAPLGRASKEGGYPPIPPLFRGVERGDGKARDPEYKTWDRSRLGLSAVGL